MARWRRMLGGAGVGLLLAVGVAAFNIGAIADRAMTPSRGFDPSAAPPAPDYALDAQWSALPSRDDLADRAPTGHAAVGPREAAVDVFYLHPTSYVGSQWNGPTTDPDLNAATDRVATGIQASAFNGCCAVYAPRYRQANGTAFYRPTPDGDRAIALAYGDVRRAFEAFQRRRGEGRPFLVASHSQGSVMAERLLVEVISGTHLRDQLVVAYVVGGRITLDGLRERAPDLAPCHTPTDLHCVAAWNARAPHYRPGMQELARPDARTRLCSNPLTWRDDNAHAPASDNLGAVFLETDDHAPRPHFADARCVDGTLEVTTLREAPRDLPSRILDHVLGAGNHHPIEFQMYFMNLRANATARVAAFRAAGR